MTIKGRVFRLLADQLIGVTDTEESKLKDDLAMDSLAMVLLLISIEEEFGIELAESDLDPTKLITVGDIIQLVEKYQGEVTDGSETDVAD